MLVNASRLRTDQNPITKFYSNLFLLVLQFASQVENDFLCRILQLILMQKFCFFVNVASFMCSIVFDPDALIVRDFLLKHYFVSKCKTAKTSINT